MRQVWRIHLRVSGSPVRVDWFDADGAHDALARAALMALIVERRGGTVQYSVCRDLDVEIYVQSIVISALNAAKARV
jgi:hypothetical protein